MQSMIIIECDMIFMLFSIAITDFLVMLIIVRNSMVILTDDPFDSSYALLIFTYTYIKLYQIKYIF